jgi:hypothetical protein
MSIIHRVEQGSHEWFKLRLGMPTASNFHKIITPKTAKLSSQSRIYKYKLIAERLLAASMDEQLRIEWIERGKVEQPHAAQQFQFTEEVELDAVGFVTTDEGRMGCSPDYLIKGRNEAVEVKCPAPWTQIGYLLDGPGDDYRPQVQGQLWIGQFDAVHFYGFHPRMPASHVVTRPDAPFMLILSTIMAQFLDELDEATERARKLGAYIKVEEVTPLAQAYGSEVGPDPLEQMLDGR